MGDILLKFINFETLDKTRPFATSILLKFEDKGVNKEQYTFLSKRLDNFNLNVDDEYSITSEIQYDEPLGILLIGIILIIPDRLVPKDVDKLKKIILDHKDRFPRFYERTLKSFNFKQGRELNLKSSSI